MKHRGDLRTTPQERFKAQRARLRAEGEKQGLAQGLAKGMAKGLAQSLAQSLEGERQLLVRMAGRKFGLHMAEPVAELLEGIDDPDWLQEVGDWIFDCDAGTDLLQRLKSLR